MRFPFAFAATVGIVIGAMLHANAAPSGAIRSAIETELIAAQQSQIKTNNSATWESSRVSPPEITVRACGTPPCG